jgi:hypothetical protein
MLERLRGLDGPGRRLLAVSPCRAAVHTYVRTVQKYYLGTRRHHGSLLRRSIAALGGKSAGKTDMGWICVLIIDHGLAASSSVP